MTNVSAKETGNVEEVLCRYRERKDHAWHSKQIQRLNRSKITVVVKWSKKRAPSIWKANGKESGRREHGGLWIRFGRNGRWNMKGRRTRPAGRRERRSWTGASRPCRLWCIRGRRRRPCHLTAAPSAAAAPRGAPAAGLRPCNTPAWRRWSGRSPSPTPLSPFPPPIPPSSSLVPPFSS